MTTLELVPAILTSDLPVPTAVAQKLSNLTPAAQLDFILDIFAQTQKADETICHVIFCAWDHLVANRLWTVRYPSLEDLKMSIEWKKDINPFLARHTDYTRRIESASQAILEAWRKRPESAFPQDIAPNRISKHLANELCRLSKVCSLDDAIIRLRARLCQTRRSMKPVRRIGAIDVLEVYKE